MVLSINLEITAYQSTLHVISKVVEKIVHNKFSDYLSESKLLPMRHFGLLAKRSTQLVISLICENICKKADSKLLTGCIFIDFSKVFDTISHAKILQKLIAYGIRNIKSKWFLDYLFNRKQSMNYNNNLSISSLVTCGIAEEFILGPLLLQFLWTISWMF